MRDKKRSKETSPKFYEKARSDAREKKRRQNMTKRKNIVPGSMARMMQCFAFFEILRRRRQSGICTYRSSLIRPTDKRKSRYRYVFCKQPGTLSQYFMALRRKERVMGGHCCTRRQGFVIVCAFFSQIRGNDVRVAHRAFTYL